MREFFQFKFIKHTLIVNTLFINLKEKLFKFTVFLYSNKKSKTMSLHIVNFKLHENIRTEQKITLIAQTEHFVSENFKAVFFTILSRFSMLHLYIHLTIL